MIDIRTQVLHALLDLLRWDRRKALPFLELLTEAECDDILEHVRDSRSPIVGVAAVVYRARMRLAGSDNAAKQRAGAEANEHYKLIPKELASGTRSDAKPTEQPVRSYSVSPRVGARRRENDWR